MIKQLGIYTILFLFTCVAKKKIAKKNSTTATLEVSRWSLSHASSSEEKKPVSNK